MLSNRQGTEYVVLNNLDLMDEVGTLNPYASGEYFFDESPEDLTLDEIHAEAAEEDFLKLTEEAFLDGHSTFQSALPPHKTPEDLEREGQLNAYTLAENAVRFVAWHVREQHRLNTFRLSLLDRIQNGNLYLAEAMKKYDPSLGKSLIAMMKPFLKGHTDRPERGGTYIRSPFPIAQTDMIRIVDANGPYYKVREFHEGMNRHYGRQLDITEVEQLSSFTKAELEEYQKHLLTYVSYHRILGDDGEPTELFVGGYTDEDPLADPEAIFAQTLPSGVVAALDLLHDDERAALIVKLGLLGGSQIYSEVASELGLGRDQAFRLCKTALEKLQSIPHIREVIVGSRSVRHLPPTVLSEVM